MDNENQVSAEPIQTYLSNGGDELSAPDMVVNWHSDEKIDAKITKSENASSEIADSVVISETANHKNGEPTENSYVESKPNGRHSPEDQPDSAMTSESLQKPDNQPFAVQMTTSTTTKVTVTQADSNEEPKVEEKAETKTEYVTDALTVNGRIRSAGGDIEGENDEEEEPAVALSQEEEQLLEKLKYQPFSVAQDIENLTPEQREKINMYQRRESLARANSLKRQSPIGKRPSDSSQGRRSSDFAAANGEQVSTSIAESKPAVQTSQFLESNVGTTMPVAEIRIAEKEQNVKGEAKADDPKVEADKKENEPASEQEKIDIDSEMYKQMKFFTPKPYHVSLSTDNSTHDFRPHSTLTPNMSEVRNHQPQRYSTLPSTNYSKMASAGDLISPSAENLKLDRSQSVKTQQDTDKMRQHVYELRMKFLGQEIPAVYPYKLYIDGEGTDEKDMVDDEITEAKKSNQVQAGNPNALQKTKKSTDKDAKKNQKEKEAALKDKTAGPKQSSNPFYKLLCGGGKSKEYEKEEKY